MMITDHGPHQPVWEALVDFAAEHTSRPCQLRHTCPENEVLANALTTLVMTGGRTAVDDLVRWMLARILDTARATAYAAGAPGVILAFNSTNPASRITGQLLTAAAAGDDDTLADVLTTLLDTLDEAPLLGKVIFEITSKLTFALIARHRQLGAQVTP